MENIFEKLWNKYQAVMEKPKETWTEEDKLIVLNGNINFVPGFNEKFSKLMEPKLEKDLIQIQEKNPP